MSDLTEALRKMSIQDLHHLEKLVAEEKRIREEEVVYKSELGIYNRLKDIFEEDLYKNGVDKEGKYIGEVGIVLNHLQDKIYYICDVVTGNYTTGKAKCRGTQTMLRNGKALSYSVDEHIYKNLAFELMDVMEKYIKEKEESK